MPARAQVYCRSYLRSRNHWNAQIDFRYRQMGRADRWPEDHRSNCAKADEISAEKNPLRFALPNHGSTPLPPKSSEFWVISPDDVRKYSSGWQWSELQRAVRKTAE